MRKLIVDQVIKIYNLIFIEFGKRTADVNSPCRIELSKPTLRNMT